MLSMTRSLVAAQQDAARRVAAGRRFSVRLPLVGTVQLPPPDQLAFYGVLVGLAALELIDWPVAVAMGVGSAVISRQLSDVEAREADLEAREADLEQIVRATPRKPAMKTPAPTGSAPATRPPAENSPAQKSPAQKSTRKTAARKTAARKTAARKTAAGEAKGRKAAARSAGAAQTPSKKTPSKKTPSRKTPGAKTTQAAPRTPPGPAGENS